jgi:hypothetical protein
MDSLELRRHCLYYRKDCEKHVASKLTDESEAGCCTCLECYTEKCGNCYELSDEDTRKSWRMTEDNIHYLSDDIKG